MKDGVRIEENPTQRPDYFNYYKVRCPCKTSRHGLIGDWGRIEFPAYMARAIFWREKRWAGWRRYAAAAAAASVETDQPRGC